MTGLKPNYEDREAGTMKKLISKFAKDESGATAIEYGLIGALISVAIIMGASALGTAINGKFTYVAGRVDDAM